MRYIWNKSFGLWELLGFHIVPNHFYYPIPNVRLLKDKIWEKPSALVGIDLNEQSQIALLNNFRDAFKQEFDQFSRNKTATSKPYEYFVKNGTFGSVDGEILYCMIRHFRPKRIIEIGSGNSTFLSAFAIQINKEEDPKYVCEFTVIEPYPNKLLQDGLPNLSELIEDSVENVPLSFFKRLNENDILFIDSSHVLNIGGDVQFEYNEILPRLNDGVFIHIHDIFLPFEYPEDWVRKEHLFWTEQYLLQAFLTYNNAFKIIWAGQYMHRTNPELLEQIFKSYNQKRTQIGPGSFWIRKIL